MHRDTQPFVLTVTLTANLESSFKLTFMSLKCGRKLECPQGSLLKTNNRKKKGPHPKLVRTLTLF